MHRILLLPATALILLLFAQCNSQQEPVAPAPVVETPKPEPAPVVSGSNAIDFPADGYTKYTPVAFIDYLKENVASGTVLLDVAPNGWIQKQHVKDLVKLLDSKEPCAGITLRNSGPNPPDKVQSSVGAEALLILESYKQKMAYPAVSSSLNFIRVLQKSTTDPDKLILLPQQAQIDAAKAWAAKL